MRKALKPRYKVTVRPINALTVRPFASGPMAEPVTIDLLPDLRNDRVDARPRPVWVPTETVWVWGFEVGGKPVSLPEMVQVRPGMPIEFGGWRMNAMVLSQVR